MSDDRPADVLGSLPRRRPHRRSDKRATPARAERSPAQPSPEPGGSGPAPATRTSPAQARRKQPAPAAAESRRKRSAAEGAATEVVPAPTRATRPRPERLRQPAQPPGVPPAINGRRPEDLAGRRILGTAAQAAAELAEIGLTASARVLRNAVARLPRP